MSPSTSRSSCAAISDSTTSKDSSSTQTACRVCKTKSFNGGDGKTALQIRRNIVYGMMKNVDRKAAIRKIWEITDNILMEASLTEDEKAACARDCEAGGSGSG